MSHSSSVSTSPQAIFHSPPSSSNDLSRRLARAHSKQLKPFNTQDIKILLLENINQKGRDILEAQGYQVEALRISLPEDQLIEKIRLEAISPAHSRYVTKVISVVMSTSLGLDLRRSSLRRSFERPSISLSLDAFVSAQTKLTSITLPSMGLPSSTLHSQTHEVWQS